VKRKNSKKGGIIKRKEHKKKTKIRQSKKMENTCGTCNERCGLFGCSNLPRR